MKNVSRDMKKETRDMKKESRKMKKEKTEVRCRKQFFPSPKKIIPSWENYYSFLGEPLFLLGRSSPTKEKSAGNTSPTAREKSGNFVFSASVLLKQTLCLLLSKVRRASYRSSTRDYLRFCKSAFPFPKIFFENK